MSGLGVKEVGKMVFQRQGGDYDYINSHDEKKNKYSIQVVTRRYNLRRVEE